MYDKFIVIVNLENIVGPTKYSRIGIDNRDPSLDNKLHSAYTAANRFEVLHNTIILTT
jgi:hypothetical protein